MRQPDGGFGTTPNGDLNTENGNDDGSGPTNDENDNSVCTYSSTARMFAYADGKFAAASRGDGGDEKDRSQPNSKASHKS